MELAPRGFTSSRIWRRERRVMLAGRFVAIKYNRLLEVLRFLRFGAKFLLETK